jgi:hypothetical protein
MRGFYLIDSLVIISLSLIPYIIFFIIYNIIKIKKGELKFGKIFLVILVMLLIISLVIIQQNLTLFKEKIPKKIDVSSISYYPDGFFVYSYAGHLFYGAFGESCIDMVKRIDGADLDTFEPLGGRFAKDKNHAYLYEDKILGVDIDTFEYVGGWFSKDKINAYAHKKIIENADLDTFQPLSAGSDAYDKNNLYLLTFFPNMELLEIPRDESVDRRYLIPQEN